MKRSITTLVFAFSCWLAPDAVAGTITVTGAITQSTPDGTGPASNNLSLNNIVDGEVFTITLTFAGALNGAGSYAVTPLFSVPAAPASESAFGTSTLTVTADGVFYDLSLLACLTGGSGCAFGDELTANFKIAAASLNGQNVAATGLDQPHPMDLLEDDGTTDIQGSITQYSLVPEPDTFAILALGLGVVAVSKKQRRQFR